MLKQERESGFRIVIDGIRDFEKRPEIVNHWKDLDTLKTGNNMRLLNNNKADSSHNCCSISAASVDAF